MTKAAFLEALSAIKRNGGNEISRGRSFQYLPNLHGDLDTRNGGNDILRDTRNGENDILKR